VVTTSTQQASDLPEGGGPFPAPCAWAWVIFLLLPLAVMAYSLWRSPAWWLIPRDTSTDWGATQLALHGHLSQIYSKRTALVSFPGLVVLSLPAAALSDLLHLGTLSFGSGHSIRPTAWYVWGPWTSLVGGTAVLAADSVAARLSVPVRRRAVLAVVEAALVWQVVAVWSHPEDALAVALLLWAWLVADRGWWTAAGWLLGAAVAVQPVVLLAFPVLFVLCPAGRRVGLVVRTAVVGALLVLPELATSFATTWHQLADQPNFPTLDHPTPLLFLAPHLPAVDRTPAVAAGPARLLSLALCCLVAYGVHRRPRSAAGLVWCLALCFAIRSLVESVMDPYYLWPALALAVMVAATRRSLYFALAALGSVLLSGYAQSIHAPWVWWGPLVAGTAVVLCAAYPVGVAAADGVAPGGTGRDGARDGDGDGDDTTAPDPAAELHR